MRKSRKFLIIAAATVALLGIGSAYAIQTHAADLRFAPHCNGKCRTTFTIDAADAVKNLYAAGSQVVVDANPSKDAVIAGALVTINGNVKDDLFAFGSQVTLTGSVGGSARFAGGTVLVDNKVGDDLAVLSGNLLVSPKASVGADLIVAGGAMSVQGPVRGSIDAAGGTLFLNSEVDGNITFRGQNLQLGPEANIKGNIDYTSGAVYDRDANAKVGGTVTYHQTKQKTFSQQLLGYVAISFLIKLIGVILAGLFLVWLMSKRYANAAQEAQNNFWKNVLWGLLVLIVTPILIVVSALTIVGLYITALLIVWFLAVLMLSWIAGATGFGWWVVKFLNRNRQPAFGYGVATLALLISVVISAIPIIGVVFSFLIILAGAGSIFKILRTERAESWK